MRAARSTLVTMAMTLVALAAPGPNGVAQPPTPSWLDGPLVAWNHPGASVPGAPAAQGAAANLVRCGEWSRPPTLAADRAIRAAGWTLFGPAQVFAGTTLVMAMADVDGMCRPLRYQAFVFVEGRFAGALSPVPMNSRTDGALTMARLFRAGELVGEFARYAPSDALCCPSRTSTVTYRVDRASRGAVVRAINVTTTALSP